MKNKRVIRIFSALLAVMLCMTVFSTVAFAGGAEPNDSFVQETGAGSESNLEDTGEVDLSETLSILFGALLNDGEEPVRMGTVTTNGGRLNVRTGAGLDNYAFTQLPNGTVVEVIGTDGDWYKIRLPEKIGYVHSGYMTLSGGEADTTESGLSLSFDMEDLSALLALFTGGEENPALTPDGNLTLIDDIGSSTGSGKQFITVETNSGNVFYLIIDRDDEGEETVHFLNQVDERDLMALMDEEETETAPAVCTCSEKCAAGAVNTSCPVCKTNLSECTGRETVAEPEPEPEQPEKKSGGGLLAVLALLVLAGGGAFAYVKFIKPNRGAVKVSSDPDDYDFPDEEYINEDEPAQQEETEDGIE